MKTKASKKQSKKTVTKAAKKKVAKKSSQKTKTSNRTSSKVSAPRKKQTPPARQTDVQAFPGYPPYPADEDITRNSKRIDANIEDLPLSKTLIPKVKGTVTTKLKKRKADKAPGKSTKKNSSDLKKEDYEALGPRDLSLDMGDDEELKHRTRPVDFSGKDMDIPGSELDDDSEAIGSEDEENNSYSLGGDNHQDLEEDRS